MDDIKCIDCEYEDYDPNGWEDDYPYCEYWGSRCIEVEKCEFANDD